MSFPWLKAMPSIQNRRDQREGKPLQGIALAGFRMEAGRLPVPRIGFGRVGQQ